MGEGYAAPGMGGGANYRLSRGCREGGRVGIDKMEKGTEKPKKTVTLYDAGGGILLLMFGVPFGIIIDYIWNRIVLSLTLRRLIKVPPDALALKRIGYYVFFITVIGLLIDWGYHVLIWDVQSITGGITRWVPSMSFGAQMALILPTMLLLLVANIFLSIKYLKLERRPAQITGAMMAVFTAPWLVPTVPYISWTG